MLVDYCSVTKANFRLWQQAEMLRNLTRSNELQKLLRVNFPALYVLPAIGPDLVAVHVREDVSLVATAIHEELVEVAHERVVSAGLGCVCWVQIDPFVLDRLELSQVVEVNATFARVASEEEDAVFKR